MPLFSIQYWSSHLNHKYEKEHSLSDIAMAAPSVRLTHSDSATRSPDLHRPSSIWAACRRAERRETWEFIGNFIPIGSIQCRNRQAHGIIISFRNLEIWTLLKLWLIDNLRFSWIFFLQKFTLSLSFSYRRFHSSAVSSSLTTTTFLIVLALKI